MVSPFTSTVFNFVHATSKIGPFINPNSNFNTTRRFFAAMGVGDPKKGSTFTSEMSASTNGISVSTSMVDEDSKEEPVLVVVSFYRFTDFPDHADLRKPLKQLCEDLVRTFENAFRIDLNRSLNNTSLYFGKS